MKADRCPHCRKVVTNHAETTGVRVDPKPGDLTVCFGCAGILMFNERCRLAKVPESVIDQLDSEILQQLRFAQTFVRMALALRDEPSRN